MNISRDEDKVKDKNFGIFGKEKAVKELSRSVI